MTTASSTGRWGIQQRIRDAWSFATIGCGYESLTDALAIATRQIGCRVADRSTGQHFRRDCDDLACSTPHLAIGDAS